MHSQEFIEEMKNALLAHKEKLSAELESLPDHTEVGDDLDEAATEEQLDDVNKDLKARLTKDLLKIDAALTRIDDGTYGVDVDSGEKISEERLRVLPWAETSL